jgi:hypothetical protein
MVPSTSGRGRLGDALDGYAEFVNDLAATAVL